MPDETGRTDRTTLTDEELQRIADFPNYREAGPMAREIIALRREVKWAARDIQAAQDALTLERRRCEVLHKDTEFKCAGCDSHTELGRGRGYICFCCPTSSFCHECAKGHFAGHDDTLAEQRERLLDAAAMVEPLRHLVSDRDCGYSPGTRLPSERLADLAEAVAAIQQGDADA